MHELPSTDISQLLSDPLFNIEKGGDKSIEDAAILIERKLRARERWAIIIVHREKGMLLLKHRDRSGCFSGLWLKTPTCGDDSQNARMTSYLLGRIGMGSPTDELHNNFVTVFSSILIRDPGEPNSTREAI